ncbi:adhesion G-protein coupled receptor G4 [Engystomops pustulosus]|uniref:adhesion G-protein coupled receptor G4 n=1 Tax=Engystomops pustulosus TaxID=76066 RepID=UPI003AFA80E6
MKDPATSRCFLYLLLMLILTTGPATSTGTHLSWNEKAIIFSQDHVVKIQNPKIPALSAVTTCLDILFDNYATSTVFSYSVRDGVSPELGFGRKEGAIQIFHLGKVYEFQTNLKEDVWYNICIKWKRQTKHLTVFVNGKIVFNTTTEDRMIKGNGSLVVGVKYTIVGGEIVLDTTTVMSGELSNFQIWNYTRSHEELLDCVEGNLFSWTKEDWTFPRLIDDNKLRCAHLATTPPAPGATSPTTTLGTTTSTRTTIAAPGTSVSAERLTSVETTSGKFFTSVNQNETATSNSTSIVVPDTLPTFPTLESGFSTQVSTTESVLGDNQLTNSSINLPTGNNVSGNISSTYHLPPERRTTVTTTTWKDPTTVQQQTTNATTTQDPQVVSTTMTPSSSTQLGYTTKSTNERTPELGITSSTTKSITPSTVTDGSSDSSLSTSETLSLPSTVVTSSSRTSTSLQTTLKGMISTTASYSGTTNITSAYPGTALPPNTVTYFFVQMTIGMTDGIEEDKVPSIIQHMMNNTEFTAVQIIVSCTGSPPEYTAKAIVRANSSKDPQLLANQLQNLLMEEYTDSQLNITITAKNVTTEELDKHCTVNSTFYDDFQYDWPETYPTEKVSLQCHTNPTETATRDCYINVTTLTTEWGEPNYSKCVPISFEDLENVTVTQENANFLTLHILNMTKNATSLPENDIRIILNKISEILALGEIDLDNAKVHVDVINLILIKADQSLRQFTNKILNLMEKVGFTMNFSSDTANVMADSLALLVSKKFKEMYFSVTTYGAGDMEITLDPVPPDEAVAIIHLPQSIQDQVEISSSKIQFNFIGSLAPFKGCDSSDNKLITYIISASIEGTNVLDLAEPINITLRHLEENVEGYPVKCVFWDFAQNNYMGGWNESGCKKTSTNDKYTSCSCNHLTHFGVLLDVSRTPVNPEDLHILSLLTYVGCGIASLFLGVALVTYGMFRQLRRDYPSKILMNLCFSLLLLNLLFLVNNWLSSFQIEGLCISIAALLHYFLLSSFTWMALEAVHMYFAFVKVFNSYIHKYILKLCIAGWGIPLLVVLTVLCIDVHFYGYMPNLEKTNGTGNGEVLFCWIPNTTVFYVSVVSYFGAVFLTNISMFVVVLLQIKSLKFSRVKDWKALFLHDIKSTLSLAFLLGLTWCFVFFAWGPVRTAFLYLFAIFNTLQGLFIFVFHCLIKENVRRHWRMYLCCGSCRIDNYSDWSRLSNADTKYNGRINLPSDSYQSTRSNNTASTSNASSLSSLSRDTFYGRSVVDGGGIFISSAHTAPSHQGNVYPNNRRTSAFQE